jgi:hypothetical protein
MFRSNFRHRAPRFSARCGSSDSPLTTSANTSAKRTRPTFSKTSRSRVDATGCPRQPERADGPASDGPDAEARGHESPGFKCFLINRDGIQCAARAWRIPISSAFPGFRQRITTGPSARSGRPVLYLLATLARLAGPDGARAVAAESFVVKHRVGSLLLADLPAGKGWMSGRVVDGPVQGHVRVTPARMSPCERSSPRWPRRISGGSTANCARVGIAVS